MKELEQAGGKKKKLEQDERKKKELEQDGEKLRVGTGWKEEE
jgi:hypothetical protein